MKYITLSFWRKRKLYQLNAHKMRLQWAEKTSKMMTCTALLIFSIGTFYHKDHDPFISIVASISRFCYKNYAQRKSTYLICGNIEQHNL